MPPGENPSSGALPPEELAHRVAVLKRFRELLVHQRNRFNEYLQVLDKQKDVIEKGDAEALSVHVEMEERIVADIFAVQKVVEPLETMYRAANPDREEDIPKLKSALETLKTEAIAKSKRNRELLSRKMELIREEIKSLRGNPFARARSVYADAGEASLVDIKG